MILRHAFWPLQFLFSVWEASHGNVLTSDTLQKKGKILLARCFVGRGFGISGELVALLLAHKGTFLGACFQLSGQLGFSWIASNSVSYTHLTLPTKRIV